MAKTKADELFLELRQFIEADSSGWQAIGACYHWRVVDEDAESLWLLKFAQPARVIECQSANSSQADCHISSSSMVLEEILSGSLSLQRAFECGSIKLAGDERAALELQRVFEVWRELRERSGGLRVSSGSRITIH